MNNPVVIEQLFKLFDDPLTDPKFLSKYKENLLGKLSEEEIATENLFTFPSICEEDALRKIANNPNLPTKDLIDLVEYGLIGFVPGNVLKSTLNNPVWQLLILENPTIFLPCAVNPIELEQRFYQMEESDSFILCHGNKFTHFSLEETAVLKTLVLNTTENMRRKSPFAQAY